MPEHVSLHSVSVQIVFIHGFIQQDSGQKSANLPFRSSITPLSASVSPRILIRGNTHGLAGTRTQGLRLAKAAIFQLIYEPLSWSRMAHESILESSDLSPRYRRDSFSVSNRQT